MGISLGSARVRGFTLLEVMLVLVIMAAVYGIAAPMIGGGKVAVELTSSGRMVAAGLRRARSLAIATATETAWSIDVENREFWVGNEPKHYRLPRELEVVLETAGSEVVNGKVGSVRFFPDGSCTGGRVVFSAGADKRSVNIDWLTGRVRLSPGAAS